MISSLNIYGHIEDESKVIIGAGNYNAVHGLLTYSAVDNLFQITPLCNVVTNEVLQLMLKYKQEESKVLFTLKLMDTDYYISVDKSNIGDDEMIPTAISLEEQYFWIDYSIIDKIPRSKLLSGALYSLKTMVANNEYVVSWKIAGFSDGDLIMFLPTVWYEKESTESNICTLNTGINMLLERLKQISFKGYTTLKWCENINDVYHCSDGEFCGKCLGQCKDEDYICYIHNIHNIHKFICGHHPNEPDMINPLPPPNTPPNNIITIIVIIAILIIVGLLAYGLHTHIN